MQVPNTAESTEQTQHPVNPLWAFYLIYGLAGMGYFKDGGHWGRGVLKERWQQSN